MCLVCPHAMLLCVSSVSHHVCNLGIVGITLATYFVWLHRQFKDFDDSTCRQGYLFFQKRVKASLSEHDRSKWILCQLTDLTPYWCGCPFGRSSLKNTKKDEKKNGNENQTKREADGAARETGPKNQRAATQEP